MTVFDMAIEVLKNPNASEDAKELAEAVVRSGQPVPIKVYRLCECGCGQPLTPGQRKFANKQCFHRQKKRDYRSRKGAVSPRAEVISQPGAGFQ